VVDFSSSAFFLNNHFSHKSHQVFYEKVTTRQTKPIKYDLGFFKLSIFELWFLGFISDFGFASLFLKHPIRSTATGFNRHFSLTYI
jgi:hypothetical protein